MIELKELKNNKIYSSKAKELYLNSFPSDERMPFWLLKLLMRKSNTHFYIALDGTVFSGIAYTVIYKDILFVFYLAVSPQVRGKGVGSAVLSKLKEIYPDSRIILNVEPLDKSSENYAERKKRKQFYYSNGFFDMDYQVKEGNVVYDMMCYSKSGVGVSKNEYFKMIESYMGSFLFSIYKHLSK